MNVQGFLSNLTNLLFPCAAKLLMKTRGRTALSEDTAWELWNCMFDLCFCLPVSLDDALWTGSNTEEALTCGTANHA